MFLIPEVWSQTYGLELVREINPCVGLVKDRHGHFQRLWREELTDEDDKVSMGPIPYDHHVFIVKSKPGQRDAAMSALMRLGFCCSYRNKGFQTGSFEAGFRCVPVEYSPEVPGPIFPPTEDILERVEGVQKVIYTGGWEEDSPRPFYCPVDRCLKRRIG